MRMDTKGLVGREGVVGERSILLPRRSHWLTGQRFIRREAKKASHMTNRQNFDPEGISTNLIDDTIVVDNYFP